MKSIIDFKGFVLNSDLSSIFQDDDFAVYNKVLYCPYIHGGNMCKCSKVKNDCLVEKSGNIKDCYEIKERNNEKLL